jgi:biopolymer transport protein ExbD
MAFRDARRTGRLSRGRRDGARRPEPDLTSLINVVFLILIFFMVAGSLRPFTAHDLELAKAAGEAAGGGGSMVVVARDGAIAYRGRRVDLDQLTRDVAARGETAQARFTIVADARLEGARLIAVARALAAAGVLQTAVLVERTGR